MKKIRLFYNPIELKNKFVRKTKISLRGYVTKWNFIFYADYSGTDYRSKKSFTDLSNTTTAGFQWTDRVKIEAGVKFQNLRVFADQAMTIVAVPKQIEENLFSCWKSGF